MIKIVFSLLIISAAATRAPHHRLHGGPEISRRSTGLQGLVGRGTCSTSEVMCGNGCIPSTAQCCPDGGYCPQGSFCWPQNSGCCSPGYVICGSGCMPPGSNCCDADGEYCDSGDQCAVNADGSGGCCPSGVTCQGQVGVTTYTAGATIVTALPSTHILVTSHSSTPATTAAHSSTPAPSPSAATSSPSTIAPTPTPHTTSTTPLIQGATSTSSTSIRAVSTTGAAARNLLDVELYVVVALAAGHVFL